MADPTRVKERLAHTWEAFFARFGRFTEIQAQAIEPLLEGRNCVLVSATASGKTEAALAPLIERYKQTSQGERASLAILHIVPTRALARDLERRLSGPLEQLSVRMQVKTGDDPRLDSSHPPQLLITTPESLDSLLAGNPRMTRDVRAVILDEIHLLDNTARGDQLRILLNRLRRIKRYALERGDTKSEAIQFCALSATVHDPSEAGARYFTEPHVVHIAAQRVLDAELIAMEGAESLAALFAGLRQRGCRKLLVFCAQRAECEQWAGHFRAGSPFGDRVFVHHASLDVHVRRETERNFAMARAAVCFATSTLELGIDIGDVDLIALVGPPDNTSAFLQRIGRGNRRTARTAVVCFYRNEMERALFEVFCRASRMGTIEPDPYFFRPSVVVQQLCSYIKQTRLGEIVPDAAFGLFASPTGEPLLEKSVYDRIVNHLIARDYFTASGRGALRVGPRWQELFEKRAIYANLGESGQRVEVVDGMTGRKLGEVGWGIRPGMTFLFGGRTFRATHLDKRKLLVQVSRDQTDAEAPRARAPHRPLNFALARAVAIEMKLPGAESPDRMTMAPVTKDDGIADEGVVEGPALPPETCLFHYAGDVYGLVLGGVLESLHGVQVEDRNGVYLMLRGVPPEGPLEFDAGQVRKWLSTRWEQFEPWYDLGSFHRELPAEARRKAVIEALKIEAFVRVFSGSKIVWAEPPSPG